jgi:hypothetical protein
METLNSGTIPQSLALSEADPLSLAELMSCQPDTEAFARNLPRIVQALRELRARFATTESEKARAKPRTLRGTKASELVKTLSPKSSAELDF